MMALHEPSQMEGKYALAADRTAPRVAAGTVGIAVEGYWLNEDLFYFLKETVDHKSGRIVRIPSVVSCTDGAVRELLSREELEGLLGEQGTDHGNLDLASAMFAMPDADTLVVTVAGCEHHIDIHRKEKLNAAASVAVAALYSPDGRHATFLRDDDVWLLDLENSSERQLTKSGSPALRYGQEPDTCNAALTYRRNRYPVGLWSPDSQWFLTHRIDERDVPVVTLVEPSTVPNGEPLLHTFRYAVPGDPIAMATYVAIHVASGQVRIFDEVPVAAASGSPIIKRMAWFDGRDSAWFVHLDRYSKEAALVHLDLASGVVRSVVTETTYSGYIDLNPFVGATPNVRTLSRSNEVIWFSERDGYGHLYLYDALTGALKSQITRGAWVVRNIVHVDQAKRRLFFLAGGIDSRADPASRILCAVDLDGGDAEIIKSEQADIFVPLTEPCGQEQNQRFRPAYASTGFSPDARFAVVRAASIDGGNRTEIIDLSTLRGTVLASALPDGEVNSRRITALAADGETTLHGILFLPHDFDDAQRYPLIDSIYPGPQIAWRPQTIGSMKSAGAEALAELGFIVLTLDTRGMPFGSRDFHQCGYPELHEPQLADHAAVIRQLIAHFAFIDGARIGITGTSGGGSATARAMCDYSDLYKVGVAFSGNYDSTFYSSSWSDRYRGYPGQSSWKHQSVESVVEKLEGKLLLIAGDMDENVLVGQTLALADAFEQANREIDLLIIRDGEHSIFFDHGPAQRAGWDYFVRHLLHMVPPDDFELTFEAYEIAAARKNLWREFRQ